MRLGKISISAVLAVAVFGHPAANAAEASEDASSVTQVSFLTTQVTIVEGTSVNITILFSPLTLREIDVNYAITPLDDPTDAEASTGSLTIPEGYFGVLATFSSTDDQTVEPPRSDLILSLTEGTHYTIGSRSTVHIVIIEGVCDRSPPLRDALMAEARSSITNAGGGAINPGSGVTDPGGGAIDPGTGVVSPGDGAINPGGGVTPPGNEIDCLDVTGDHLGTITDLDLSSAGVTTLKENDFLNLDALRSLDLSGNRLAVLPENVFSPLGALRELSLSENDLTTLTVSVFSGLSALRTLDLHDNRLTQLSPGVFSTLTALNQLFLNENALTTLTAGVFDGLNQLRILDLHDNRLTQLSPGVFSTLTALNQLFLNENALTTLTAGVFDGLNRLRILNLHENELARLPENIFSPLPSLEELSLSSNRLTALPPRVFAGLSGLRSLWLGGNLPGSDTGDGTRDDTQAYFDAAGNAVLTVNFKTLRPSDETPFEVHAVLELREGTPFDLDVVLRAQGVELSSDRVTLSTGDVQSSILTVIQTEVDAEVALTLPPVPDHVCERTNQRCYQGFRVVAGEPLDPAASWPPFPEPTLSLASTVTIEVGEGATAEIIIDVEPFAPQELVVNYTIGTVGADDDVADAEDYVLDGHAVGNVGSVTVPRGSTVGVIRIAVSDDQEIEPLRERFTVSLAEGSHYTLASPTSVQIVIKEGVCDRSAPVRDALTDAGGETDCSDVTDAHLDTVMDLNLSSTNLTALKENDFLDLDELMSLNLSDNRLSELPEDVFLPLDALRELSLNGNALTTLTAGVFDGLSELQTLNLHDNQLSELPEDVFSPLDALNALSLNGNDLTTLAAGVFASLIELQTLNLHDNRLSRLTPGVFSNLVALNALSLSGNDLTTLTASAFDGLNRLRILSLHENQLAQLPENIFSPLASLEELSLSSNRLTTLPARVFAGLSGLRSLWLGSNLPGSDTGDDTRDDTQAYFDAAGNAVLTVRLVKRTGPDKPRFGVLADLSLREGAPFDLDVVLETRGVELSSDRVTLSTSDVQSSMLTVIQTEVDAAVALIVPPVPDHVCERTNQRCYQGFRVVAGEPLDPAAPPPPFPEPTLSLASTATIEIEEGATAEITIDVEPFAPQELAVNYTVGTVGADDDVADAEDYAFDGHVGSSVGSVTIPRGSTVGVIRIAVSDDQEIEPLRERFTVSLAKGLHYTLASPTSVQVVIKEGVCDRSAPVRDALTDAGGETDCSDVTDAHLNRSTDLDLASADLTALKEDDFLNLNDLRSLDLSDNRLSELPEDVFSPLASLEKLSLSSNRLTTLPPRVFTGLSELQTLNLHDNRLSELPEDVFSPLASLEELSLSSNRLTTLPPRVFTGLSKLQTLNLRDNRLSGLPLEAFSSLGNLDELFLSGNSLTALPADGFDGLNQLRILALHENQIARLPRGIFSPLASLEELSLSSNRLTALPPRVFADLSELRSLWLGGNLPGNDAGDDTRDDTQAYFDAAGNAVLTVNFKTLRPSDGATSEILVVLELREGAPFDMNLALEAEGTEPSSDRVTLSAGEVQSDIFTVSTPTTVTLTLPPVPDHVCERTSQRCYQGFRVVAGEPLDLAAPPPPPSEPTLSLVSAATIEVEEGATAEITIDVEPFAPPGLVVNYTVGADDDVADAEDYVFDGHGGGNASSVTISSRSEEVVIQIAVSDDQEIEPLRERFTVSLAEGLHYTLASPTSVQVVIKEGVCDRSAPVRDALTDAGGETDCSDVTDTHLGTVTDLNLSSMGVIALKENDFLNLDALRSLDLSDNRLSELPEDVFSPLASLEKLNLSSNRLTTLPPRVFTGLSKLQTLNLHDNRLSELPENVFSPLDTLRELSLNGNDLTALTAGVFDGLSELQTLNLHDNRLSELPEDVFPPLATLRELSLNGNDLTTLTAGVFDDLSQLRILALHDNQIAQLPENIFSPLASLEELSLSSNRLTTLPARVFAGLSELRSLWLGGNLPGSDAGDDTEGNTRDDVLGAYFDAGGNAVLTVNFKTLGSFDGATPEVHVVLELREGAPFDMTLALEAEGTVPSSDRVTLSVGEVQSDVFTASTPTVVSLTPPPLPDHVCERTSQRCYQGFRVVAGDPLVLAKPTPSLRLRIRVFLEGALDETR